MATIHKEKIFIKLSGIPAPESDCQCFMAKIPFLLAAGGKCSVNQRVREDDESHLLGLLVLKCFPLLLQKDLKMHQR